MAGFAVNQSNKSRQGRQKAHPVFAARGADAPFHFTFEFDLLGRLV